MTLGWLDLVVALAALALWGHKWLGKRGERK